MPKKQKRAERHITTTYFFRKEVVKVNRSAFPDKATVNAFNHMQFNDYGATVCEVTDNETGRLYAVFRRYINGDVKCHFSTGLDFVTRSTLEDMKARGLIK